MLKVEGIRNALAIGPVHAPAIWYPVGNGREPKDWETYSSVLKKLVPADALRSNRK